MKVNKVIKSDDVIDDIRKIFDISDNVISLEIHLSQGSLVVIKETKYAEAANET